MDIMNRKQYQYRPLSSEANEIRLLSLLPAKFEDPIYCEVLHESLDNKDLKYHTLSYVWGDPVVKSPILVEGHLKEVTTNLRHALQHLRKEERELVIWVDAICINQQDSDEKTQQVGMMGNIYKRCEGVYTWLGCDESMDLDVELNNSVPDANPFAFFQHFADNKHIHELPEFKFINGVLFYYGGQGNSHKYFDPIWSGLYKISQSPWFTRIWTVQEAILPPSHTLVWGHHRIPWSTLDSYDTNEGQHISQGCCLASFVNYPENLIRSRKNMKELIYFSKETRKDLAEGQSFRALAYKYNWRLATDARDKIFGLLGLLNEQKVRGMRTDYNLNKCQVYENAFRIMIEEEHHMLDCFLGVWFTNSESAPNTDGKDCNSPSWVPDFEAAMNRKDLRWTGSRDSTQAHIQCYSASGDTSSKFQFSDGSRLHINGKHVGTVSFSIETQLNEDASNIKEDCIDIWQQELESLAGPFEPNTKDMFLRTLTGDLFYNVENRSWKRIPKLSEDFFEIWLDRSKLSHTEFVYNVRSIKIALVERVLFVVEDGTMGLCPKHTRIGDEVWVFDGGRVPFVARPLKGDDAGYYHFIGDCYMHGVMYGEAYKEDDVDEGKREIVII